MLATETLNASFSSDDDTPTEVVPSLSTTTTATTETQSLLTTIHKMSSTAPVSTSVPAQTSPVTIEAHVAFGMAVLLHSFCPRIAIRNNLTIPLNLEILVVPDNSRQTKWHAYDLTAPSQKELTSKERTLLPPDKIVLLSVKFTDRISKQPYKIHFNVYNASRELLYSTESTTFNVCYNHPSRTEIRRNTAVEIVERHTMTKFLEREVTQSEWTTSVPFSELTQTVTAMKANREVKLQSTPLLQQIPDQSPKILSSTIGSDEQKDDKKRKTTNNSSSNGSGDGSSPAVNTRFSKKRRGNKDTVPHVYYPPVNLSGYILQPPSVAYATAVATMKQQQQPQQPVSKLMALRPTPKKAHVSIISSVAVTAIGGPEERPQQRLAQNSTNFTKVPPRQKQPIIKSEDDNSVVEESDEDTDRSRQRRRPRQRDSVGYVNNDDDVEVDGIPSTPDAENKEEEVADDDSGSQSQSTTDEAKPVSEFSGSILVRYDIHEGRESD